MQFIALLTLVIIAGFFFKKESSPYARIVVGSVFGIMFFTVWPFTRFAIKIYDLNMSYYMISYGVILIIATLVSLFSIQIKYSLSVAIFMFSLFASTIILSVSFDGEIKNRIAIQIGFFDKKVADLNKYINVKNNSKRNIFSAHHYIFSLNKNWRLKTDKGSLFKYYQLLDKDQVITEFRPKCFNSHTISLPEIINNLSHINQPDNICHQKSDTLFFCKSSSLFKKQSKRIRWYLLDTESTKGIELDFVLFKGSHKIENEVKRIIGSAKITDKMGKDINCLGLTEWM